MNAYDRPSRRRPALRPCVEPLDTRALLTGGAGNVFAVVPSAIDAPGGSVAIPFAIAPGHFVRPRGTILLGIDVSGQGPTAVQPVIRAVADGHGHPQPLSHGVYDPKVRNQVGGKVHTSAVLVTLGGATGPHGQPPSYTVRIAAENQSSGGLRAGFYLPGDANGDGVVDQADIKTVRSKLGARAGDANYSLDADADRDGLIDRRDLAYARQNLGVKTTLSPTLTARPDPANAVDARHLTTHVQDLHITGTASPGATIALDETRNQSPEVRATAGADGHFTVVAHLVQGANAFTLTAADDFGQHLTGVLPPIKYTPPS